VNIIQTTRHWAAVFAIAAVFPTGVTAGVGDTRDIFSNGGFEAGTKDWTPDAQHKLVEDQQESHSGRRCLSGEVQQTNRALRLLRTVDVRAGNRYEFTIWARGTAGTKLVLWAKLPQSNERTLIASWPGIKSTWQQYRVPVSISADGKLQLEIISPSSHGATPGRIWIDDLALLETEMPPLVSVSQERGFSDEPAMAAGHDGSLYVAFNQFLNGADSLQIARYQPAALGLQKRNQWQVAGGPNTFLLTPFACQTEHGVALFYAAEQQGNWEIHLVNCGPDGPHDPSTVTQHPAVDVKPAAAAHAGALWLAWESNRDGSRQVFVKQIRGSEISAAVPVSQPDTSSYSPSIAVMPNGEVVVAWHSFADHNYDIYMRRRLPDGTWQPIQRLTTAASIDRHAVLQVHKDRLWIAYENAQTEKYYVTRTNHRNIQLASITDAGLMEPVTDDYCPLDARCEAANFGFDQRGRMWLTMLKPRLPRAGWDVYLTRLEGQRWQPPVAISGMKGMDRRPQLVLLDNHAYVAFQADSMPLSWSDLDSMAEARSDIFLADVKAASTKQAPDYSFQPIQESEAAFDPAAIRVARGEDSPTSHIQYGGETLYLFYGDLHEHSDVSICNRVGDQSLDESYQHLRDLSCHDFVCITDHGYNINPYLWNYSAKWARINDDPNRFLPFLGQEWTSTFEEYDDDHPHGFYGHRNLILEDLYFPSWWNARNRQTPSQVWDDLRALKANFVHIPHQLADTGNVPTDWSFHDEVAQPVAEIFQTRGSYEYHGAPRQAPRSIPHPSSYLHDAWADQIVIGVIASPDHGGGYGKACVYAKELTRASILDALRDRHCYGTTAAKIFLDVRVNGHLMGEKIDDLPTEQVVVTIHARCPAPIDRIEVCRNNEFIYLSQPNQLEAKCTFIDSKPLNQFCYYYVRVMQTDGEIAWSSPVWFGTRDDHHDDHPE
jgi:hypothetical protein